MNWPRIPIDYVLIAMFFGSLFAIYSHWISNETGLILAAVAAIGLLARHKSVTKNISLDEAIKLVKEETYTFQNSDIIPRGTIKFLDVGTQWAVMMEEMLPWKYLVGYRISGASLPYQDYLMTVSVKGTILSNEKRQKGWRLKDEVELLKITAPGTRLEVLPRAEAAERLKIGETEVV